VHDEFSSFLSEVGAKTLSLDRLKQTVVRIAETSAESGRILAEKRTVEIKRLREQQRQLIRMKMDQLISDEEFTAARTNLVSKLAELDVQEIKEFTDSDEVLGNIDRICLPLQNLATVWRSLPVEMQRRFQMMALPTGYVFGRVRTAPRGRLFSVLSTSSTSKSSMVPPTGLCWNQLAEEIEAFATIFREKSGGIREQVPS